MLFMGWLGFKQTQKDKKNTTPEEVAALEKLLAGLGDGQPARMVDLTEEEEKAVRSLGLLTRKPVIYAANVPDTDLSGGNALVEKVRAFAEAEGNNIVVVSAQVESELAQLSLEEKLEFLAELGVAEGTTGLEALVRSAFSLLGLQTYFTAGPTESRAWTIKQGMKAPQVCTLIVLALVV